MCSRRRLRFSREGAPAEEEKPHELVGPAAEARAAPPVSSLEANQGNHDNYFPDRHVESSRRIAGSPCPSGGGCGVRETLLALFPPSIPVPAIHIHHTLQTDKVHLSSA